VGGDVVVQFTISESGKVADFVLLHASNKYFGKETELAVKQWTFNPGVDNRTHIPAPVKMRCRFIYTHEETDPTDQATKKLSQPTYPSDLPLKTTKADGK
jgi:TonB family protein